MTTSFLMIEPIAKAIYDAEGQLLLSEDRILTARQGGRYRFENLVPACLPCNQWRGDRPFQQAMFQTRKVT